jgi:hypothetical protein
MRTSFDAAGPLSQHFGRVFGNVLVVGDCLSPIGTYDATGAVEKRRLPRAIRTHHPEEVAAIDRQRVYNANRPPASPASATP